MADLYGFDANQVKPSEDLEAIPTGEYRAVIVKSENKATKAGTGEYLKLTFQVDGGDYHGRLVWARLNMKNPNAMAVEIAERELAAICYAVNVMNPRNSETLHKLPMIIKVVCKKRSDSDEMGNEIKSYKPVPTVPLAPPPAPKSVPPYAVNSVPAATPPPVVRQETTEYRPTIPFNPPAVPPVAAPVETAPGLPVTITPVPAPPAPIQEATYEHTLPPGGPAPTSPVIPANTPAQPNDGIPF